MSILKIGFLQQHNTADMDDNKQRLASGIAALAKGGAQLVVLQELHNGLYFCQEEDVDIFDQAEPIPGPSTGFYGQIAQQWGVVIVVSLFEKRAPGLYHNTAVVIEKDGTIAGKYRKMHIPDDPAYYEKFYFAPGDLGFQPINTSVGRLGVLVCWDQWYPEAARLMALRGAEILIYPTAIGYTDNDDRAEQQRQREAWTTVMRGHAVANGLPVVAVNRVGRESLRDNSVECRVKSYDLPQDGAEHGKKEHPEGNHNSTLCTLHSPLNGITFWGSSFVCGPQGELLHRASEHDEEQAIVSVDLGHSEQVRRWWPFLRDRCIDSYAALLKRFDD